jgi:hypothetical protein
MLTIISHLRNLNQQHNEMPLLGSYYQKKGGRKKRKEKGRKKESWCDGTCLLSQNRGN